MGSAMAFIDASVVTIALPAIQAEFTADLPSLQWVVNGYMLILGALLLVGGGLRDRVGRRRVSAIAHALLAAASVLSAPAPSMQVTLVRRLLPGTGAAALVPPSLA